MCMERKSYSVCMCACVCGCVKRKRYRGVATRAMGLRVEADVRI